MQIKDYENIGKDLATITINFIQDKFYSNRLSNLCQKISFCLSSLIGKSGSNLFGSRKEAIKKQLSNLDEMTDRKEVLKKMVENMNKFQISDKRCQSHGKDAKFCPFKNFKNNEMISSIETNFQSKNPHYTMDNPLLIKDKIEKVFSKQNIKEGETHDNHLNGSIEYHINKNNFLQKKCKTKMKNFTENKNKKDDFIQTDLEMLNKNTNNNANPIKNETIIKDDNELNNKDNLENKDLLCKEDEGIINPNEIIKKEEDCDSEDTEEENLKQIIKKKIIKKRKKKFKHIQKSTKIRKKSKTSTKVEDLEIKPKSQENKKLIKNQNISISKGKTEKATPTHLKIHSFNLSKIGKNPFNHTNLLIYKNVINFNSEYKNEFTELKGKSTNLRNEKKMKVGDLKLPIIESEYPKESIIENTSYNDNYDFDSFNNSLIYIPYIKKKSIEFSKPKNPNENPSIIKNNPLIKEESYKSIKKALFTSSRMKKQGLTNNLNNKDLQTLQKLWNKGKTEYIANQKMFKLILKGKSYAI